MCLFGVLNTLGQTLDEVIIDFTNAKGGIAAGSFYVAMSRVRLGENLYLRGFEENYIQEEIETSAFNFQIELEKKENYIIGPFSRGGS